MHRKALVSAALCSVVLALYGCTANPQKRLERVAKDWSMTIRASQVIPIYPLEEDFRPGDIYLTTRSVEAEIASWNQDGFLPLVNRFARISIPNSKYNENFKNAAGTSTPPTLQRLPKASFPSYNFNIDRRGSLGLALPLSSVPLALAFSGAQSATGSVVLKKATTQGLPDMVMDTIVRNWAAKNHEAFNYQLQKAKRLDRPLILRAITRVFSINGASVSLTYQKATSFGADAGAAPAPPQLLSASPEDFNKRVAELHTSLMELKKQEGEVTIPSVPDPASEPSEQAEIAKLEEQLRKLQLLQARTEIDAAFRSVERASMIDRFGGFILPGGSARIASRSAHGVSMVEDFDKPLVVGYWALEYLVLPAGGLIALGNVEDIIKDPAAYKSRADLTAKILEIPIEPTDTTIRNPDQLPIRTTNQEKSN